MAKCTSVLSPASDKVLINVVLNLEVETHPQAATTSEGSICSAAANLLIKLVGVLCCCIKLDQLLMVDTTI